MTDIPATPLPPIVACRFDGEGGMTHLALEEIGSTSETGFVWVHLHRDEPDAMAWLRGGADLPHDLVDALTADDTRPRCTVLEDGALLNLRGVNLNPGDEPEDMVSVRFWLDQTRIVGVWVRPLRATSDIRAAGERGQGPTSPGDFIAKLALRLIDRMEPVVATLNERVDSLEERVIDDQLGALRGDLAEVRRMAIVLRRYIAPQRDALSTFTLEDFAWISDRDRRRLLEATDRTTRLAEELDAIRERAAVIHDQLADKRAEEMNRHMLVLAVVAAIFLPLGLLTGLLGINVAGIPGSTWPWAFAAVTAALVVLGVVQFWLYRRWRLL